MRVWVMNSSAKRISIAIAVTALATFAASAVLVSVVERKQEARNPFFKVVELTDDIDDPAVWGKNFPMHYSSYKSTVDMVRTRYGGSEALPHTPSRMDPRHVVAQSKIEQDPRLKRMWLGYPFSVDFREERGHAYMFLDQQYSQRVTGFKQPGTCLNCHASVYLAYRKLGNGDLVAGFEKLSQMPYAEASRHAAQPVACIDCHDPKSMQLRITRPAFLEGIRVYKASQGVPNYDPNTMASTQEMRSFVCGQCHVEYYFQGPQKRLVFPWHKGLKVEEILAYYDEVRHKDFVHKESGAGVLKAQHPEFEMYNQGVHARSGVACADCHMPYRREGGLKISDHHVRSPLLNINRACQGCHHFPEQEMKDRVELIQTRFYKARNVAMDALMDLISDIKAARDAGAAGSQLEKAWDFQRKAQFYLDFVEAENSTGFHAPQEALRIVAESIDFSRRGQLTLRRK
ncbi:MAG: ammonia-forming cytochrome c nitrite reductase subunit c552 [Acidobacteria bacterium]|nr:ammonia-forming cytochrome c nitrite reductase subunit c552 [Acidobacteriota bacterium]